MNYKKALIFAALPVFIITAVLSLSDNVMTPYVKFEDARDNSGKYVQIIGTAEKESIVKQDRVLSFLLSDGKGVSMKVTYSGQVPANFEHSEQVVALGSFSRDEGLFKADKLLVKCPSKYVRDEKK